MKSDPQRFVSSLERPWALVRVQGDGSIGRRPASAVAWLEYPKKNAAGEILGYFGGIVWQSVRLATKGAWFFRYKNQKVIRESEILYRFPVLKQPMAISLSGKFMFAGPTPAQVKAAKKALPKIIE